MAVFIGLVFVAYVYVWRKGGLDWTEDTVTPVEAAADSPRPRIRLTKPEVVGAR